ncbi:type II toxin-antitoxin system VapC family toxin [Sciscionella marina]|uniref:type II toxin-antitoxin system VapC family toxin n=1 Tax=Sciscionella marina TaxID=508770 RepID=UPI00035F842B|nr:type II toxin-antitoxin system VapC family toxin [Sciscionella marina]
MGRVVLDTGVLIAGAKKEPLPELDDADDIAIPVLVVAEFLAGIELDQDEQRAAAMRGYLDSLLEVAPTLEYDDAVAEHHAELLAHTRRSGKPRDAHDLIIAATARSYARTVYTTDARTRFDALPGVECVVLSSGQAGRSA